MFITLCWDVLHSSHQICMEKIKLTSVKFKFSKTSQQESNPSAINAISDRLFFLARSSCPPPLLYMSRGQMPTGCTFGPPWGVFITWMPVLIFICLLCAKPDCRIHNCLIVYVMLSPRFLVLSRNAPPPVGRSVA